MRALIEIIKERKMDYYLVLPFASARIENENGEILIGRQPSGSVNKPYPGRWDLPGGKLEPGESFKRCCIREVEEETGLSVVNAFLYDCYHHDRESVEEGAANFIPGVGICFTVTFTGELKPDELEDMHWAGIDELNELGDFDLTPWTRHYLRDIRPIKGV